MGITLQASGGGSTSLVCDDSQTTDEVVILPSGGTLMTGTGMVAYFAGLTAPSGWLECPDFSASDSAYPLKSAYPDLYAYIGDVWGTLTDTTRFKLPNSSKDGKGYFLRGVGGELVGTRQDDVLKEHKHTIYGKQNGGLGSNSRTLFMATDANNVESAPTGDSLETRPMAQTMLMCIKY